jgi:hypothetical protein
MAFLRPGLFLALILTVLSSGVAQQPAENQTIFTISVAAPTKAKDVQVRYFYSGELGSRDSSVTSPTDDNNILIKTGVEGQSATTLKLVAYAPGCQLVTISVSDLASSNRQGAFQCAPLSTVQFSGRANTSTIPGKALQAQVLYECNWCPKFFGLKSASISPFTLGKADIAGDGSFTITLPDFTADPSWSSLSNDASLFFYLIEGTNGQPVGALKPSSDISGKEGALKVAPGYPQVDFSIQNN